MDKAAAQDVHKRIIETRALLRIEEKRKEADALEESTNDADFWKNPEKARTTLQHMNGLRKEIEEWDLLLGQSDDALCMYDLLEETPNPEEEKNLIVLSEQIAKRFAEMEFYVLLGEEYDTHDAIVSFHAGAGGADAQDWAEMLYRMITRFCEKKGWGIEVVDYSRGAEAGLKNATIRVHGRYAYGHLRSENGVHRLVRISPFDAEKMRHTSFAMVEVMPELGEVEEIEIPDHELRIDVFRSGGKGGQSVNTTDSAVRIVHEPSGITVVCQNEKSQHQNKELAMKILKSRLLKKRLDEKEAERLRLRGKHVAAEWGNQIRSYVLHPYKMVKDHRTEYEVNNPDTVLSGDLQAYVEHFLRWYKEGGA